ncbi:MAG: TonB-dependent receptor [Balneolaceae bacterium]
MKFKIHKHSKFFFLLLLTFCFWHNKAVAQNAVTGTVYEAEDSETMPGVNIVLKGTTKGTSTDVNGEFRLEVESLQDTLVFSYVGYQTLTVPINGQSNLTVELHPQAISGDDMIVVGYGVQKRTSLTSSVSDISAEQIENRPISNSREALQGLAPGLTVMNKGGAPGAEDIRFRMRGLTTIGDNEPLIVVDGAEQRFYDLDPNEIESISILKDASATAIYGSRGANGVILVTTKGGQQGEFSVSYDGYLAIQELAHRPEHLGLEEYMNLLNVAEENASGNPVWTEEEIDEYVNADDRYEYPLPNAFWDALFSPALQQNHTVAVSGGTDRLNMRFSTNFFDQDGILPNFSASGLGANLKANVKVSEAFNVDARFGYRQREEIQPYNAGDVYWGLWQHSEWTVPKYPDGTYGISASNTNPLMFAEASGTYTELRDYLSTNIKAELEPMAGLSISSQLAGYVQTDEREGHRKSIEVRDYYDPEVTAYEREINSLNEVRARNSRYTWNNLVNYQVDVQQHAVTALLGHSEIRVDNNSLIGYREMFYNNELPVLSAGPVENQEATGGESEESLRSFFGRLNYSFDDKYIFEANGRYDGSSKFYGADNQYGFFPSFSAAWRLSEEEFWNPLVDVVNEFKLRGSWGETGNNSVGLYTFFDGLGNRSYNFNGNVVDTYYQSNIPNVNLTWETTTQTDVGFDLAMFDNKVNLAFDYFNKRTEGILLNLPIPGVVGMNAPPQNAGVVDNWGWEIELDLRNYNQGSDFGYSITAQLADVKNKVVDLAGTGPYIYGSNIWEIAQEGKPLYSYYGYVTDGFFESYEQIEEYGDAVWDPGNMHPGDIIYKDLNDDGEITPDGDRDIIGNQMPRYTFGLNTDFSYKNFGLNLFFQGVGDVDVVFFGPIREGGIWGMFNFTPEIAGDYWTEDNRDALFPRPEMRTQKNTRTSDYWVVDGSYIKLKNAQLSYNIPSHILSRVGINNMRLYVSATNLFTLSEVTKWGIDPESSTSERLNYYPQTRHYTAGVNIKF